MEAGVKLVLTFEQYEVEDADAYTLFKHIIFLSRLDLVCIHFSGIEQGAVRPYL